MEIKFSKELKTFLKKKRKKEKKMQILTELDIKMIKMLN